MSTDAMSPDGLDIGIDSMIRDEPGNRVQLRVQAADDPQAMELRLESADSITWWKSLSYFMKVGWWDVERFRIETKDDTHAAEQFINPSEILQFGRLELWKGGFIGFGARVATLDMNTWANRGRRFVFTWHED